MLAMELAPIELTPEAKAGTQHGDIAEINHILFPDDAYLNGVYWADLPRAERWRWINHQQNTETKRELAYVWNMFKEDPLEPVRGSSPAPPEEGVPG